MESPDSIAKDIAERVKARRLEYELTQSVLAAKAGIPLATYRRFERTGEISLRGLVLLAIALNMTAEFSQLFATPAYKNLDELIKTNKNATRKRGRRNG